MSKRRNERATGQDQTGRDLVADDLLTMEQAIERLKTTRPTFQRWLKAGRIGGMKVGRQWRFREEDLGRFMAGEEPRVAAAVDPGPLIDELQRALTATRGVETRAPERSIESAVNLMLWLACARSATDLRLAVHLPPGENRPAAVLRLRVGGVLHEVARADARLLPPLIERLKTMAACDPRESRRPQTGRTLLDLQGQKVDYRVTFRPTHQGEAATLRFIRLDQGIATLSLDRLGMDDAHLTRLRKAVHAPNGLVVINGPAGSGKTTTLYGALLNLDRQKLSVVSIEDPVEVALPFVEQTQLDPAVGLDIAQAMRAVMRSDPDVILIGEIRSAETARLAAQAALIGHLVLTTTHAAGAVESVLRLVDLTADPLLIADALKLVVSQLLIRQLDPDQSESYDPAAEELERAAALLEGSGVPLTDLPDRWRRPRADADPIAAYRGSLPINELISVDGDFARCVRRGESETALRQAALAAGMRPLAAEAIRLAAEGRTALDEAFRVVGG